MLRLTRLETRETPASWASIAEHYLPGHIEAVFGGPAPDVPIEVLSAKLGSGPTDPVYDVYLAGEGGGPRVIVHDTKTGRNLMDFFAFEESFRGGIGIEGAAVIGSSLYVSPGSGGGPVVCRIDLLTQDVSRFSVAFPADWRGGLRLSNQDIDHVNGAPSPHPAHELIVLPGSTHGGAHLLAVDAVTGETRRSIMFAAPEARGGWEFAPAGDVSGGYLLQPAGTVPHPVTYQVPLTVWVPWDGSEPRVTVTDPNAFGAGAAELAEAFPELGIYVGF